MVGRSPVFLDQSKCDLMIEAFRDGATIRMACELAGVGKSTFQEMKAAVIAGEGEPYETEFLDRVTRASAEGNMARLRDIKAASRLPEQWKAAAWILERRLPDEWGAHSTVDVNLGGVLIPPAGTTPEQWIAAMAATNAKSSEPGA